LLLNNFLNTYETQDMQTKFWSGDVFGSHYMKPRRVDIKKIGCIDGRWMELSQGEFW